MNLEAEHLKKLIAFQKNELTEHHIYQRLARMVPNPTNQEILKKISAEELYHYRVYRKYTQNDSSILSSDIILYIAHFKDDQYLIGTYGGGMYVYDTQ